MKSKAAITALALMVGATAATAQTHTHEHTHSDRVESVERTTWSQRFAYDTEGDRFRANEFSFDVFGSYLRQQDNVNDLFDQRPRGGDWGAGVGVNYFFTRHVGVGGDAFIHDNRGSFIDTASANAILRLPIDAASLAPYIYAGAGRNFDAEVWNTQAGVGLEFRLNANTGIFLDGRYAWGENSNNYSILRSGLRFAF